MPRRTWLDQKVDALLEELAASGMDLDRQRAGELITDRVHAVAALMRVTAPTARKYLDDETVRDIARRMLFEFAAEQPGADLLEVPRTVPVPLAFVGIIVAALAEAMQVRAANEPSDRLGGVVATYGQMLSGLRQITTEAASGQAGNSAKAMFPARVAAPCRQVHRQRRRPGREWWQPPGRGPRGCVNPIWPHLLLCFGPTRASAI